MKVRSNLNPAIVLLLLIQLMLGALRIQIVPLGYNVDEIIHFAHTKLVAAACLRDSIGLSWSLHKEDSLIGEDVTEWIAFNDEEIAMISPVALTGAPCQLLFDDRRLTNAAYYIWAGIPMAIFNNLSDRETINLGRFFTLFLGLLATSLTFATTHNLFPKKRSLQIGAASIMAINHQLGDITAGINTDAGAMFAISLLFYNLSQHRSTKSTYDLLSYWKIIAALVLCLFTKSTAWIGIPLTALWIWASLPEKQRKWILVSAILSLVTLTALFLPIKKEIPAHWFWNETGERVRFIPAEIKSNNGPVGNNALIVNNEENPNGIVQYLAENEVIELQGQTITIGGWVNLATGSEIGFPNFATSNGGYTASTIGNGVWQFRSIVTEVPEEATYLAVILPAAENATTVLYDGLILVKGKYPDNIPPSFSSPTSATGNWGTNQIFTNMLRNGTVETLWPRIGWKHIFGFSPNRALWSFSSWDRTHTAWLRDLPGWLFAMYWSGFGGTQPGLSRWQLIPLFIITFTAAIGLAKNIWTHKLSQITESNFSKRRIQTIGLLTTSTILVLLMIILRTDIYPHRSIMLIFAGTRYGLPAMLPISILFALGWTSLFPRKYHNISISILVLILFVISTYIILGVQIPFYNCTIDPPIRCLYP